MGMGCEALHLAWQQDPSQRRWTRWRFRACPRMRNAALNTTLAKCDSESRNSDAVRPPEFVAAMVNVCGLAMVNASTHARHTHTAPVLALDLLQETRNSDAVPRAAMVNVCGRDITMVNVCGRDTHTSCASPARRASSQSAQSQPRPFQDNAPWSTARRCARLARR